MTPASRPLVIAHRGASGYRPEHTALAHDLAIDQGADFIELDLVMTRDGVAVCRHDPWLDDTTDVARHARFADRRRPGEVDGRAREAWWVEDFTLEELKTLRARTRLPTLRPLSAQWDGQARILTLDEAIALAERGGARRSRAVGLYVELKHPRHYGPALAEALMTALDAHGLNHAGAPVFLQCFWPDALIQLRSLTRLSLVMLMDAAPPAPDVPGLCGVSQWREALRPGGLARIAAFADALGPSLDLVLPRDHEGRSTEPTPLIRDAHQAGLAVHAWTFACENARLPRERRSAENDAQPGDGQGYAADLFDLGLDGLFADHPDVAINGAVSRAISGLPTRS